MMKIVISCLCLFGALVNLLPSPVAFDHSDMQNLRLVLECDATSVIIEQICMHYHMQ